jgi:polysaccharide pyruvyl transferase WcaK-like protein
MDILITGLTLHNNKGGPALALSLIKKIRPQFQNAKFYLAVPDFGINVSKEEEWAKFYNIDGVIGSIGAKEFLYINSQRRVKFVTSLKEFDLVIDLTALSYMDLPHMTYKKNLIRNLSIFTMKYFCNILNIPMIRWTQSYGPFKSMFTKFLVKYDLKKQKHIFIRGSNSVKNMEKLFNNTRLFSFPDIAILLDSKDEYHQKYLKNDKYITLSPSSVIYSRDEEKHIEHFQRIIKYINNLGYKIVIVPHNLMSINPNLKNCDLEVSKKILENTHLVKENIHLVEEDIDVYNLKGIISNAQLHIGARYHSIIASLSSGVPTIAFSWHEKYQDIMQMYNMEKYVYNGTLDINYLFKFIDELLQNRENITDNLQKNQHILEKMLNKNIDLFMENYHEM